MSFKRILILCVILVVLASFFAHTWFWQYFETQKMFFVGNFTAFLEHQKLTQQTPASSNTENSTKVENILASQQISNSTIIGSSEIDSQRSGQDVRSDDLTPKKKWVILLHSTANTARLDAVTSTWFRTGVHENVIGLLVFGGNQIPGIPFSPNVGGSFENSRKAFELAFQTYPTADMYCKFDDDAFVFVENLISTLEDRSKEEGYWGYEMFNGGVKYASGGGGYALSRAAVEQLVKNPSPSSWAAQYEDAGVGDSMRNSGFPHVHVLGFHPDTPHMMVYYDLNGHLSDRLKVPEVNEGYGIPISYHYMKPEEIRRIGLRAVPKLLHVERAGHGEECQALRDAGWDLWVWDGDLVHNKFPQNSVINKAAYNSAPPASRSAILQAEVLMLFGGVFAPDCRLPANHSWGAMEEDDAPTAAWLARGVTATFAFSPLACVLASEVRATDWSQAAWAVAGAYPRRGLAILAALRRDRAALRREVRSRRLPPPVA